MAKSKRNKTPLGRDKTGRTPTPHGVRIAPFPIDRVNDFIRNSGKSIRDKLRDMFIRDGYTIRPEKEDQ